MTTEDLSKFYAPSDIETKWYEHWERNGYFHSTPDDRPPFSIVIPPPNVTGVLHMGHMLNNTIQDVLIRRARMRGFNACWVPGTDHASIATEAKVVRWLRDEKNMTKGELGREDFMRYAWEWTEKYGGIILSQLKKLGASCDWQRTAFTLDDTRSKAVIQAFVDLYRAGRLYRDWRMVNWDPQAQTVLSNEEVIYEEEASNLYHVRYPYAQGDGHIIIATTRPETILADAAIAVHPDDQRYAHLIGRQVSVPIIGRVIPIIADDYVDPEFGTGALKVTPAHDPNDYEIGQRHQLEVIDIMTEDGKLNEKAVHFVGLDREEARVEMKKALKEADLLESIEPYLHKVGRSERTRAVVEPRLSLQWYVRMSDIAEPALQAVLDKNIEFVPENQTNLYRHWMENIKDWCISRQLWWGHRIPAYYYGDHTFVATTPEEALAEARKTLGNEHLRLDDLSQDEDVLDTWFSSWLWPFSVFMTEEGDTSDLDYYYPTTVLVTGWDIIFLWVARMIMAGYEWHDERPFDAVYFTGMVRDNQRRKMSKSLGNSPDALELIEQYGADGVRFGMLSCSPAGGDLLFDEKLCEQGSRFCNKLWNALKLMKRFEPSDAPISGTEELAIAWFEQHMAAEMTDIDRLIEEFRLSEALIKLYTLIWDDFCSWFLEMMKPRAGRTVSKPALEKMVEFWETLVTYLHPFMPFITEELWHHLRSRAEGEDCMITQQTTAFTSARTLIEPIHLMKSVITQVRDIRNKYGLKDQEPIPLYIMQSEEVDTWLSIEGLSDMLIHMANLDRCEVTHTAPTNAVTFVVQTTKCYLVLEGHLDPDAERARLEEERDYVIGFIQSVKKKLDNDRFVSNAPTAVVDKERKKLADGEARLRLLEESLANL